MASLDNLGYSTYIKSTIKSVTECEKILVYNRNSFINDRNYSRLSLYSLDDIFYNVFYYNDDVYNENCLVLNRTTDDLGSYFQYGGIYSLSKGFNMIIYIHNNTPTGYTEFMNTQGQISNYVRIFLSFNIEVNNIEIKLDNSLVRFKDRLAVDFIGTDLNKYPSSKTIVEEIKKVPKDQKYTSHLSTFLSGHNRSNVFLGDRAVLSDESVVKLNLLKDINISDGEEYSNYQIGYYQDDIVLYSWIYIDDSVGYYYRITSLITQEDYKYTRLEGGAYIDTINKYDMNEISKEILYCSGKYIVFRIYFKTYSIVAPFDTSIDNWVYLDSPVVIIDPLDKTSSIYELPKYTSIQDYDELLELFPDIADTYLDISDYISENQSLGLEKKFGDWFFIKTADLYIATCMSYSVYLTVDEYLKSIVVNNNTLLIDEGDYYAVYHGVRQKEYYTEKARSIKNNTALISYPMGSGEIMICKDDDFKKYYSDYYKKSEVAIIYKTDLIYNTILESYRRQPLYTYQVPSKVIGAIGSIIFYINNYNNINYI